MTHLTRLRVLFSVLALTLFMQPLNVADAEQLRRVLPAEGCAILTTTVEHSGVLEEIKHAYAWNDLLEGTPLVAINHQYFSPEDLLNRVDSWTPEIACIAREFAIPPELLAGIMAIEMDLDFHLADAIADGLIRTQFGRGFCEIEMGAAYGGVHFLHLRPALATLGRDFSESPFYQTYYHMITTRSNADLTCLTTRYPVIDLANAAVMARYYALLRLGKRPMADITVDDMAFVWSAYRGGVVGTPADPSSESRWSLDYLQKADNPRAFGDTLIALPYFSYYRSLYHMVRYV